MLLWFLCVSVVSSQFALAQEQLKLEVGQLLMLPVKTATRVAVADPDIVDVNVISENEVLLQAKKAGNTNLLVWDTKGQTTYQVAVIDLTSERTAIESERILSGLKPQSVTVRREGTHLVLTGTVGSADELKKLQDLAEPFPNVTNLVAMVPAPVTAPPLIELAVQLVEMSKDAEQNLGVDWSKSVQFTETPFEGQPEEPLEGRLAEAFRIGSITRRGTGNTTSSLSATVNFLVQNGKARVLAEPKLVTTDGKEATSFVGAQVPIITTTTVSAGAVSQSIEFKEVGVRLTMKPTLVDQGQKILTNVKAEVSRVSSATGLGGAIKVGSVNVPAFTVRQAQTDVSSTSGQTIFIAGLLSSDEKQTISKLPTLGSVPVLGNLFRSTDFIEGKTELVIMVTPTLIAKHPEPGEERMALMERSLELSQPVAPENDPRMQYALKIQQQLTKEIRFPEDALSMRGTVKLQLTIQRDGSIQGVQLQESSGDPAFDLAALELVRGHGPFAPFPSMLSESQLLVTVPIIFISQQR